MPLTFPSVQSAIMHSKEMRDKGVEKKEGGGGKGKGSKTELKIEKQI